MATSPKKPVPASKNTQSMVDKHNAPKSRLDKRRQALAEATRPDQPVFPYPAGLQDELKPYWLDTVNTKTGDYWSRGDIPLLKLYCRCACDIDRLNSEIETEGEVIENARGNPVVNPKVVVRGFAENRFMTLCTKLRLQPSSRGETKDEDRNVKRKKAVTAAAQTLDEEEGEGGGDGLLAGFFSKGDGMGGGDDTHAH